MNKCDSVNVKQHVKGWGRQNERERSRNTKNGKRSSFLFPPHTPIIPFIRSRR